MDEVYRWEYVVGRTSCTLLLAAVDVSMYADAWTRADQEGGRGGNIPLSWLLPYTDSRFVNHEMM